MTAYPAGTWVITDGDGKLASIFFDHVYPLDPAPGYNAAFGEAFFTPPDETFTPWGNRSSFPDWGSRDTRSGMIFHGYVDACLRANMEFQFKNGAVPDRQIETAETKTFRKKLFAEMVREAESVAFFSEPTANPLSLVQFDRIRPVFSTSVTISLSKLELIDTRTLGWKQVREIRKDKDSIRSLRRLHLFLFENYSGKSSSYIEDDLLRRIDDYQNTIRRWNFDTLVQSLETVASSKSLPALAAAVIASAFGGAPLALAVGATFELGQVGITIAKQRKNLKEFREDHPLAYLIALKGRGPPP